MTADNSIEELYTHLPPILIARARKGEVEVLPGQNPSKPVVREVGTGRLVPGSGRYPRANDPAHLGKTTAYKHSKSYREALEALFPVDGDESRPGSLAWLAKMCREAGEGSPQTIDCPECGYHGLHVYKKDGLLLFKLVELLTGKARETQDLNIKSESLIAVLNGRVSTDEITVHTIDPATARARREVIEQDE